jgi:hypothetical protein
MYDNQHIMPHPERAGDPWATLLEFMHERADWLRVYVAENEHGSYDVVLRIDGSYGLERDAHGVATLMRDHLERLARREGLALEDWWDPEPGCAQRARQPRRGRRAAG